MQSMKNLADPGGEICEERVGQSKAGQIGSGWEEQRYHLSDKRLWYGLLQVP